MTDKASHRAEKQNLIEWNSDEKGIISYFVNFDAACGSFED